MSRAQATHVPSPRPYGERVRVRGSRAPHRTRQFPAWTFLPVKRGVSGEMTWKPGGAERHLHPHHDTETWPPAGCTR